jgi:hypothetical protein
MTKPHPGRWHLARMPLKRSPPELCPGSNPGKPNYRFTPSSGRLVLTNNLLLSASSGGSGEQNVGVTTYLSCKVCKESLAEILTVSKSRQLNLRNRTFGKGANFFDRCAGGGRPLISMRWQHRRQMCSDRQPPAFVAADHRRLLRAQPQFLFPGREMSASESRIFLDFRFCVTHRD